MVATTVEHLGDTISGNHSLIVVHWESNNRHYQDWGPTARIASPTPTNARRTLRLKKVKGGSVRQFRNDIREAHVAASRSASPRRKAFWPQIDMSG